MFNKNSFSKELQDRIVILPPNNVQVFFTKTPKQNTKDLKLLLIEADKTQINLEGFLLFVNNNFPNSKIIIPKIKGLDTINMLLKTRWQGDASKITDYSRATISFSNIYEMYNALIFIQKTTLIIVNIKDNFLNPTKEGYRDINIVFQDYSNKHLAEIQLVTHPLLFFKNKHGHNFFGKIRNIKTNAALNNKELTIVEKIKIFVLEILSKIGYKIALLKGI